MTDTLVPPSPCHAAGRAQLIADSIPHIVWTAAPDGATTYFNDRGTDYTGHPPEANYGWSWVDLVHPDDADRARLAWEVAARTGSEFALEYRIRRFDGAYRWHACRALPILDVDGEIDTWIGTATDVDAQKQLELSLRESERQANETLTLLRGVETSAPVGFKLVGSDLRVVRINERLARISGYAAEDAIGLTVAELVPDLWPQLEDVYRRALTGQAVCNLEVTTPSAEAPERARHWLASYYPVRIDGEIIGVGNVVVDITKRKEAEEAVARNLAAVVNTVARAVEHRDPYTAGHQRRVAAIAAALGEELGLDASTVEGVRTAASIHDLGKISVPAEILSKPGRLSAAELELVKQHAETGYEIVAGIDFPWPVAEMIRQHHERLDGSGYPRGLRGDAILLGARIIAVADVVEAMTSHRPYRPGLGLEAALRQIEKDRGRLLDDDVVDACLRLFRTGRLRASGSSAVVGDAPVIERGGLRIDVGARQVTLDGAPVALTAKELDLLAFFALHPNRAFSREELLRSVWSSKTEWQTPATVTEHVRRLRLKIERDPCRPRLLTTVRSVGYRFEAAVDGAKSA